MLNSLSQGLLETYSHSIGMMEGRSRRPYMVGKQIAEPKRLQQQGRNYFSMESFLVLLCLTVSLLILPLVLPPLPPPPSLLLLMPLGILGVLLVLAFMPSDVREIASSYL